ncbi:hypothetical protein [Variovorax sp. W2I14]|uniref:hypothetical protein n=1 Tax=Variovorax sp. W2I14 TaxID=3042290 RepID=UPI003D21D73D
MNKFSPLDPMAMWRELTAQWEKSTNEFANETMASDPFRQGMHGGMNASLTGQKALGDLMARYPHDAEPAHARGHPGAGRAVAKHRRSPGEHQPRDGKRTRAGGICGRPCAAPAAPHQEAPAG